MPLRSWLNKFVLLYPTPSIYLLICDSFVATLRVLSLPYLCRRLSRSSSNLILDQKPIEASAQSKEVSVDLLKNGNSHHNAALENASLLDGVNCYRSIYTQRKRKSAVETNRLAVGPGRVIAPFPEGTGNAGMRKSQSVHDLIHDGKEVDGTAV